MSAKLAAVKDVPAQGDGALIVTVDGTEVGLYRVGEEIVGWRNICPHGAAPVCRGEVDGTRLESNVYEYHFGRDREILQCPWHGWEFDLTNGSHLAEGSTARLRGFPVKTVAGHVYDDSSRAQSVRTLRVAHRSDETRDVAVLSLAPADDRPLPAWTPGTHIEVALPSGLVRHYSLCGDPADRDIVKIAVRRSDDGQGGSLELHQIAVEGAELSITAFRNRFPFAPAQHTVFIAGGIGITPIMPMIANLVKRNRPFSLLYTGRTVETMPFVSTLSAMSGVQIVETQRQGRADLEGVIKSAPVGAEIYCCGPSSMIAEVQALLAARGEPERFHFEAFTAVPLDGHSAPKVHIDSDVQFDVEFSRSGITAHVQPGESILAVAAAAGVVAASSCKQGWCGTCETRVLDGVPDHRDTVLTEVEQAQGDTMMICVGRSQTTVLRLDL